MHPISMSFLAAVEACPPSAFLPRVRTLPSAYASRGSVLHDFLRAVPDVGREEALKRVPDEHKAAAAVLDLNALPASRPGDWAYEVAYAYRPATGTARELGRNIGRDYEPLLRPGEIPGTADVVGLTTEEVVIIDYKSGWKDLGPVEKNRQLQGYLLAACRTYGKDRGRIAIIRLREDGTVWMDGPAYFEAHQLDTLEDEFRALVTRAAEEEAVWAGDDARVRPVVGDHCAHCPALPRCPAHATLLRNVLAAESGLVVHGADGKEAVNLELTPENALAVFRRLDGLERVLGLMKSTLRDFARATPIEMGDGWVYGEKMHPTEKLDATLAEPILREVYGEAVAGAAIVREPKLTKDALKEALRFYVDITPGAKIGKVFETALKRLREQGAARTTYAPRFEKYRVKALLPPKPSGKVAGE